MPKIVHFEIPTDDLRRAKAFYSDLFGWRIEKFAGPMEYWMITTDDDSEGQTIAGGMMKRQNPKQPITNYIGAPSVDEYIKKIIELGGKVVVPKTAVPAFGFFAVALDTEENTFGIWEDDSSAA